MDLCDEGLMTAFGPFGRVKVIENLIGGSLTVSKDGQQIIDCYLSDPTHKKSLQSIVVRACSTVSSDSGDGSMASLIVVNSLMRLLQKSMLISSNPNVNRIFQLKAIENIILTVESKRLCISQFMLNVSVWQSVSYRTESNNLYLFIRGFWGSILQPATNSATATLIGAILVRLSLHYLCNTTDSPRVYLLYLETSYLLTFRLVVVQKILKAHLLLIYFSAIGLD